MSVPQIILYVDGGILAIFALMYMNQRGHSTLEKMIGLPPSNPQVVSILLSIDGYSKWANALMMILGAAGGANNLFILAVAISHFFWAFLQFDQNIRFNHILTEHAQPNIGCLQIIFGSSLLFYAFKGMEVWGDWGAWICASACIILCVTGKTLCFYAMKKNGLHQQLLKENYEK